MMSTTGLSVKSPKLVRRPRLTPATKAIYSESILLDPSELGRGATLSSAERQRIRVIPARGTKEVVTQEDVVIEGKLGQGRDTVPPSVRDTLISKGREEA